MNSMAVVAILLIAGVAISAWCIANTAATGRAWRIVAVAACALALWFTLYPPSHPEDFARDTLIVLTPGITSQQIDSLERGAATVALPGVDTPARADAVADLGSALRAHPSVRRLVVIGGGLPARDRDAARGLAIVFDAAPLPRGLVEWSAPMPVRAGSLWRLQGRVSGIADARIELRDPADAVVATAQSDSAGHFQLQTAAMAAGRALFELRVLDSDGALVESLPVPLVTRSGDALRVLLLAGAPDPELKYLRRWATDAGLRLTSRMTLSDGIAMHEGRATLDMATLTDTDVLIVDERSWAALDAAEKAVVHTALHDGLGLLLRVTGPLPADVAADWTSLGIALTPEDIPHDVEFEDAWRSAESGTFTRAALVARGAALVPLLRTADGTPLAIWRAQGRGRIAAWWLHDAWRLRLAGDKARYGGLWSSTLATIARARAEPTVHPPQEMRVSERAILCGLANGASVTAPSGAMVALIVDPVSDERRCAGYWPDAAGWHTLISAGSQIPFRVRASTEAPGLARAATADATRLLAGSGGEASANETRDRRLPRWPFFLLWLALGTGIWWYEKREYRERGAVGDLRSSEPKHRD